MSPKREKKQIFFPRAHRKNQLIAKRSRFFVKPPLNFRKVFLYRHRRPAESEKITVRGRRPIHSLFRGYMAWRLTVNLNVVSRPAICLNPRRTPDFFLIPAASRPHIMHIDLRMSRISLATLMGFFRRIRTVFGTGQSHVSTGVDAPGPA